MPLFRELQRRNVFRVGAANIVAAWLIMQVADVILNNIEAPGWVFHVILLLLTAGFIPALKFSWAYELASVGPERNPEEPDAGT